MKTYYVESEEPCGRCNSAGLVLNPQWADFFAANPDWRNMRSEEWEKATRNLPRSEEDECGECDGAGVIRRRVSLIEALAEINRASLIDAARKECERTGASK